jgi:hypothetical protein
MHNKPIFGQGMEHIKIFQFCPNKIHILTCYHPMNIAIPIHANKNNEINPN